MLIGSNSNFLLKQTRSKAKMYEYGIPDDLHIPIQENANELLLMAIASIGNISAEILNEKKTYRVVPPDKKRELEFASRYFDAFFHSKIEPYYNQYYLLLGSIAYYFCDYIGSSNVMANMIDLSYLNLGCNGIEVLLARMLNGTLINDSLMTSTLEISIYKDYLYKIVECYNDFFKKYVSIDVSFLNDFRTIVYAQGTSRELLLTDAMLAILLTKIERSAFHLLPEYSNLSKEKWKIMLNNNASITELWPAQISLGEAGIFLGNSAVVQMPTSSGKTTSMSITIRSAFMANRTSMAVVVAPFRALCREISSDLNVDFSDNPDVHINEFSDILEAEDLSDMFASFGHESKSVMVLTPEKLIYLLLQDKELVRKIGLIIFDEAHMFDDASRGARYELLISTIIMSLDKNTQKILLSAVIPNAKEINGWFTKGEGKVIADSSIRATEKSVAIIDWKKFSDVNYGYLYFIDPHQNLEFYVPRVVKIYPLNKLPGDKIQRYFPQVDFQKLSAKNNDMAIYLALKLNHNGGVAIFCGRKDIADNVLKRILELEKRGIDVSSFQDNPLGSENEKIANLIKDNYGENNIYYYSAKKSVFAHHRGISNGIRLAVEYAMKEGLIRLIICTSTLSQGVNLPIKYLIISSLYQAQEKIKVRDFHNLIGRAGRAGLYTEGTILFSEAFVYSNQSTRDNMWKWRGYVDMLDPENSESCLSQLLLLIRPINIDIPYQDSITINLNKVALLRYKKPEEYDENISEYIKFFTKNYSEKISKIFQSYIFQMNTCLDAIESYLLSFITDEQVNDFSIDSVISNTLGYYLSNEEEKINLQTLFTVIQDYLVESTEDMRKLKVYSRTLLSIKQLLSLEDWIHANSVNLLNCENANDVLQIIILQIVNYSDNKTLRTITSIEKISNIAKMWINGNTYRQILDYALEDKMLILKRKKEVIVMLNDIIDVCDNGFGYSATLIINAISELLNFNYEDCKNVCSLLKELNTRMRYGLPSQKSIHIYEAGFSDRIIALKLANELSGVVIRNKRHFEKVARKNNERLVAVLNDYPAIYTHRLKNIYKESI